MPKSATYPTLFDNALRIDIFKLSAEGYMKPGRGSGEITWSRKGEQTASVGIMIDTTTGNPFIELSYKYKDQPRKYRVYMEAVPSNLGVGRIWYFRCPRTGKRCRYLYLVGGWFLHRDAFRGCCYDSQIESKRFRSFNRLVKPLFDVDKAEAETRKPYYKKYYGGQPTRKYRRVLKIRSKAASVRREDVDRAITSII